MSGAGTLSFEYVGGEVLGGEVVGDFDILYMDDIGDFDIFYIVTWLFNELTREACLPKEYDVNF